MRNLNRFYGQSDILNTYVFVDLVLLSMQLNFWLTTTKISDNHSNSTRINPIVDYFGTQMCTDTAHPSPALYTATIWSTSNKEYKIDFFVASCKSTLPLEASVNSNHSSLKRTWQFKKSMINTRKNAQEELMQVFLSRLLQIYFILILLKSCHTLTIKNVKKITKKLIFLRMLDNLEKAFFWAFLIF